MGWTNVVFLVYPRYDWKLCSFLLDYLMFEIVQLDHAWLYQVIFNQIILLDWPRTLKVRVTIS